MKGKTSVLFNFFGYEFLIHKLSMYRFDDEREMTTFARGYYLYLLFQHEQKDDTGEVRRCRGTTLRTQFSMINKWFKLTQLIDIERIMPQILDRLREFEQDQPSVSKALTFKAEDIVAILALEDSADILLWKSYMVVAKAMAGRGIEVYKLEKKDVRMKTKFHFFI